MLIAMLSEQLSPKFILHKCSLPSLYQTWRGGHYTELWRSTHRLRFCPKKRRNMRCSILGSEQGSPCHDLNHVLVIRVVVWQVPTLTRKGLLSFSVHNQPQLSASVRTVAPGEGWAPYPPEQGHLTQKATGEPLCCLDPLEWSGDQYCSWV